MGAETLRPALKAERLDPVRWDESEDIRVLGDDGTVCYAGPKYLRCSRYECHRLVTHGMVRQGGCWCGNRRLLVALKLTKQETAQLKAGYYPLVDWEIELVQPMLPAGKHLGWGNDEEEAADWRARV